MSDKPFWETTHLLDMNHEQWESVCDGCAKCCLTQLEHEDTQELVFTDVACDLLNDESCRCTDYENRSQRVPHCVRINKQNVEQIAEFAPPSCAYRLLVQGEPLPDWHHLVTGDRSTVHDSNHSVRGKVRFASEVAEEHLEDYIVDWVVD